MFTGIIEEVGKIIDISIEGGNWCLKVQSPLSAHLQIDQSLSHDGICLTIIETGPDWHKVVAVEETLSRTNLKQKKVDGTFNLERAMLLSARLDGHMVQGHVDATATCIKRVSQNGSHLYMFECNHQDFDLLMVDKGSVTINGVSLTVILPTSNQFQVAIIPYTYQHTTFKDLEVGDLVNIEFDIIGKYVAKQSLHYLQP